MKQKRNSSVVTENSRKRLKINEKIRNDEIIDSESESESDEHIYDDDTDPETEQDKRINEAKLYLNRLKEDQKKRLENECEFKEAMGDNSIKQQMKIDYFEKIGRAPKLFGAQFRQVDFSKSKIFKPKEIISCLTFSADGLFILTGSKRASICKWQIDAQKIVCSVKYKKGDQNAHKRSINAICASQKLIAVGDESNDITIRKADNLEFVRKLNGHRGPVTALVFHCDSMILYSASADKTVKIWSIEEMMELETLFGHEHTIRSIDCSSSSESNAEILTAGGQDNTIRLFKVATESQLVFLTGNACVDIVRFIDNDHFVSGANNGDLALWSKNKKKPIYTKHGAHSSWIVSLAVLRNSNLIASGDSKGLIILWKIEKFQSIVELTRIQHDGFVNSMLFASDSKQLFAAFGSEHRFGRWEVTKAPSSLLSYSLDFN